LYNYCYLEEEMNVPDEIAELKAAAAAERTYIKSRAYEETIYGESSYDYNYQSPALKSRVRGGGIQYSEPKRAIIKIAQAPPTPIYIE
jgi:ribosomal protein S5